MSRQRVIRSGARRAGAGARSLVWLGAAAALPVVVTILVLVAGTLAVLVFADTGFDRLPALVATEWLVLHRVPLVADGVEIGMLPLLAPIIIIAILAFQTRAALVDAEADDGRAAAVAVGAVSAASLAATGLAILVLDAAPSDYAVRESGVGPALGWTLAVALAGTGLGVWLRHRHELRKWLPGWAVGGLHLGIAFTAATWLLGSLVVTALLLASWGAVGDAIAVADSAAGLAALTLLSIGYLPNLVLAAATVALGGEAYLGAAGYSVFAVAPGPVPDMPLGHALPVGEPHWAMQFLVVVTAAAAMFIARTVAPRFDSVAEGVKATWLGAVVVAIATGLASAVAGGALGALGLAGTGELIGMGLALLLFGVIGSITMGLTLAGLVRRRDRQRARLEARRRGSGGARAYVEPAETWTADEEHGGAEPDEHAGGEPVDEGGVSGEGTAREDLPESDAEATDPDAAEAEATDAEAAEPDAEDSEAAEPDAEDSDAENSDAEDPNEAPERDH